VAKLIFRSGPYAGKSVSLPAGKTIVIGRNRDIDLPLPDLKLSRKHCQITVNEADFVLKDLNSTNGTFVNGTRLSAEVTLNAFDRIVVGDTEMEFQETEKSSDFVAPFGSHDSATATRQAESGVVTGDTPETRSQGKLSPLELALKEMMLPLPPEPPPSEGGSAERAKVFFCDSCDASIPVSDWQLGNAKELDGKNYCKDCIAKGVVVGNPVPKHESGGKSVDEILAGLNEEAVVVDTTIKRRGVAVADEQLAQSIENFERVTQSGHQQAVSVPVPAVTPAKGPSTSKPSLPARAAPVPAKPAASTGSAGSTASPGSSAPSDLGDEFEEIG
jgi:hypothetical protein